ncbi:MAG: 4Fe-4S binding protein [Bacteroidales bacterium]|nr:4Fe-4S binding protein [Bacteroidales bacterium]
MGVKTYRIIVKGVFFALALFAVFNITPNKYYMLILLGLTLVITLLFRTVFCGWVCPIGTLFDLLRGVGKGFGKIPFVKPINKKYKKWIKKNTVVLRKIDKYVRFFRYVFFLWILQSALLGIASIKNEGERGIESVLYLVIVMLVAGLFIERAWCKYSCPVGALMGIVGKLSPTSITRNEDACISCNICSNTCPMNIDVVKRDFVKDIDCQTCMKCVDACPVDNALDLKMKPTLFNKKDSSKRAS